MKLTKRIAVAAMVAFAAGLAAAGVATATTTPRATTYTACVTTGGQLYKVTVNGTPKCSGSDRTITWNAMGPRGYTGPIGPRGKQGPAGPVGPTGTTGYATTVIVSNGDSGTASLELPTGNYILGGADDSIGPCNRVVVTGGTGTSWQPDGGDTLFGSLSITAASGQVQWTCTNTSGNGNLPVIMDATPVTTQ
jgi:hypothetical protein